MNAIDELRMRQAAPMLLHACKAMIDFIEGKPDMEPPFATMRAAIAAATEGAAPAAPRDDSDDTIDMVSKAMRRAWSLGQTYWQQADSDSYSQNKKSDETQRKFDQLVDDTVAHLRPRPAAPLDSALWNAYAEGRSDEREEAEAAAPLRPFGIEFDPEDERS